MKLYINCLIKWADSGHSERILCLHPGNKHYYCIDTEEENAWPLPRLCAEVEAALKSSRAIVLERDEIAASLQEEHALTDKQRKLRDDAWGAIKALVMDEQHAVMDRRNSGKLIKNAAEAANLHVTTIYKYLRRYWQRGQTIHAIQPNFHCCGGPGQQRLDGNGKLGGPNANGDRIGVRITEEHQKQFTAIISKHYFTTKRFPFMRVYEDLLNTYYTVGHEIKNGKQSPVHAPIEKRPSFAQFRYFFDKTYRKTQAARERLGERPFNQNNGPVTNDQTKTSLGIGDIYQVDATIADVHLVHSVDEDIVVGRPIVYLVIDVFSNLIAGVHITFDNMSYGAFCNALWTAFSNKELFCAQNGVLGVDPADWPSKGLPRILLTDQGSEFVGKHSDDLAKLLSIHLKSAPAYSPIMKAIVERHFKRLLDTTIKWLPGAIPDKEIDRGGKKDYRTEACMTREEFCEAIVRAILAYNTSYLEGYNLTEEMIEDKVDRRPHKIWEWALTKANKLRDMNEQQVRVALLPIEDGTVTEEGIRVKGLHYTSARAREEEWFEGVRTGGKTWKVRCAIDPYMADHVYRLSDSFGGFEVCDLTNASRTFVGWPWCEVDSFLSLQQQLTNAAKKDAFSERAKVKAQIDEIMKRAEARRKANGPANIKQIGETKYDQRITDGQTISKEISNLLKTEAIPAAPSANSNAPAKPTAISSQFGDAAKEEK